MTSNVYPPITAIHAAKNRSRSAPESASEYLEELFTWFDFVYASRTGASANSSGLLCLRLPSFLHEYWERTVHRSRISSAALARSFLATVINRVCWWPVRATGIRLEAVIVISPSEGRSGFRPKRDITLMPGQAG